MIFDNIAKDFCEYAYSDISNYDQNEINSMHVTTDEHNYNKIEFLLNVDPINKLINIDVQKKLFYKKCIHHDMNDTITCMHKTNTKKINRQTKKIILSNITNMCIFMTVALMNENDKNDIYEIIKKINNYTSLAKIPFLLLMSCELRHLSRNMKISQLYNLNVTSNVSSIKKFILNELRKIIYFNSILSKLIIIDISNHKNDDLDIHNKIIKQFIDQHCKIKIESTIYRLYVISSRIKLLFDNNIVYNSSTIDVIQSSFINKYANNNIFTFLKISSQLHDFYVKKRKNIIQNDIYHNIIITIMKTFNHIQNNIIHTHNKTDLIDTITKIKHNPIKCKNFMSIANIIIKINEYRDIEMDRNVLHHLLLSKINDCDNCTNYVQSLSHVYSLKINDLYIKKLSNNELCNMLIFVSQYSEKSLNNIDHIKLIVSEIKHRKNIILKNIKNNLITQ
jgi:hypothetical protein